MRARKRCGISATVGLKWFNHQSIVRFFWFKAYLLIYYYLLISNSLLSSDLFLRGPLQGQQEIFHLDVQAFAFWACSGQFFCKLQNQVLKKLDTH